jgi:hypothetical protein
VNALDISAKLARGYSGAVYDVLRELGVSNCTLPPSEPVAQGDTVRHGPAAGVSRVRLVLIGA